MKIEIELEEVERLKKQIEYQDERIENLERDLQTERDKTNVEILRQKAVTLAEHLFKGYLDALCKSLGFDNTYVEIRHDYLERWLGKYPFENEQLEFEIGAKMKEGMRKAFIHVVNGAGENYPSRKETLEI